MRAISRRTPSKPERTTALGVSSMMKSTPVRFSSARMLRPSRPMIRPFMSSDASCTTATVVSVACPAAIRCMQTERMLRTRRSASRLVSSSIWRTSFAESWRIWSSSFSEQQLLGLRRADARDAFELALQRAMALVELDRPPLERGAALVDAALAPGEIGALGVERLLLAEHALLDPHELGAPGAQRRVRLGARHGAGAAVRAVRPVTSVEHGGEHEPHCQQRRRDHDLHGCSSSSARLGAGPLTIRLGSVGRAVRGARGEAGAACRDAAVRAPARPAFASAALAGGIARQAS